jgi:H+/Cl- antiporter ClcA
MLNIDREIVLKKIVEFLIVIFLALFVGVTVGVVETVFSFGVMHIGELHSQYNYYLTPFLFLAALFLTYIYKNFGGKANMGPNLMFKVSRGEEDHMPMRVAPMILLATWVTHLVGGSAGKEGAGIQIGATIGNNAARIFKFEGLGQIMLLVGMSSAFASLFEAPIAAIFFALEVTTIGAPKVKALLPCSIGAFTAYLISEFLGYPKLGYAVDASFTYNAANIAILLLFGVIFAAVGLLFIYATDLSDKYLKKFIKNDYLRVTLVGIPLSLALMFTFNGRYSGLGTSIFEGAFVGDDAWYDFLLKIVFTALTLTIGLKGGKLLPLIAIGASLGAVLGEAFGIGYAIGAALGCVAILASATNSLIWPIFAGAEMFGYQYIPLFMIVTVVAYVSNFDKSIYNQKKVDFIKMFEGSK